jgi:hypothetical protein
LIYLEKSRVSILKMRKKFGRTEKSELQGANK